MESIVLLKVYELNLNLKLRRISKNDSILVNSMNYSSSIAVGI